MKRLCVFCGANPGLDPAYRTAAQQLGQMLAQDGIGLVFGGGSVGLMGTVADAALDAGGEVIGVIPQALVDRELAHRRLRDLRIVSSMHERKALMADLSDGFIALPGGVGTLEELFEVWTWRQIGYHDQPIGLLNVGGFYDGLLAFLRHTVSSGFLEQAQLDKLHVGTDADELLGRLHGACLEATGPDSYRDI